MTTLIDKIRNAACWGEEQFDVLHPQDAAQAVKALEAANALIASMEENGFAAYGWEIEINAYRAAMKGE